MGLFSSTKKESVALIDIGSASVGGAYVHFSSYDRPSVYYTVRIPVEPRANEAILPAMLRSLAEVGQLLIAEGAPILRQETGSAHVHTILASVGAPWQSTSIRTEQIAPEKPFTFTQALLHETLTKTAQTPEGYLTSGESVIATSLNGYETNEPFGRRAKRADLVIISSAIEKIAAGEIETQLRHTFHTHTPELTAFAVVSYTVFRDLYPHQKDFIVLDVSGTNTDAAFIRHGVLVGVESVPQGLHDLMKAARGSHDEVAHIPPSGFIESSANTRFAERVSTAEAQWLQTLQTAFRDFAGKHPLPRTIFLLADADSRDFLKRILDTATLRTLWLSDEPLTIIPVVPGHLATYVQTKVAAEGDAYLTLLALFYQKRLSAPKQPR